MQQKLTCWLSVLFLLLGAGLAAQPNQGLNTPIPLDPAVRTGKLANGLTYYIRKNAKPEKRVEMRLAVNAGSMQEDPDQLGLAHFTEHMCFNGTKNFSKNELVSYLQSVGVRFGSDLNAYTSFDETVYILPLPADSAHIVDKGLQILEDWAHQVTFDGEEIDKERGVVIEEWRLGRGAGQRMRDRYFPILFSNSRYAERLPIGTLNILENFSHETIRKFYRDWYRPDLMAVIVVGDIDVDDMERKIKAQFGRIPARENPRKRETYPVPGHKETLIATATDKEATSVQVQVMYKHDKKEVKTIGDMRHLVLSNLYNIMLNQRLSELREKADPPFVFGASYYGELTRSKDNYVSFAQVQENKIETGLNTLLLENERVKRFGFTAGELERAKKDLLRSIEREYNERDKTESDEYTESYVQHFLDGNPAPGIEFLYQIVNMMVPQVTLEEVNTLAQNWLTDENRVVIITGPEKEGLTMPSEQAIRKILAEAGKAELSPYQDKEVATSMLSQMPKAGKISAEKKIESLGITEFTLSNGAKVVLKPTDFKNDEILIQAFSFGGHSIYPDADHYSAINTSQIIGESGVGQFSTTDLRRMMAGKTARVSPSISSLTENLSGSASPADLETAMQLIYLYFTEPRQDEEAFNSFLAKSRAQWQNMIANPQFAFVDEVQKTLSQNHPRGGSLPRLEDYDKIDFKRVFEIYRDRFADASDFTFFFVGNFEVDKIKPLLETYIASLPAKKRKETWKDLGIRAPKGMVSKEVRSGTDPKSQVNMIFTGETPYDAATAYYLRSMAQLLNIKLIESVREDQGGAYTINASASASRYPVGSYSVQIQFPCAPDNVEKLIEVVKKDIKTLQENGPDAADLQKVKEAQRREHEVNVKQNRYWLNTLYSAYYQQSDPVEAMKQSDELREGLTAKDIQDVARKFMNLNEYIQVVLKPVE